MKKLLCLAAFCAIATVVEADNSPIVYNRAGDEIGLIARHRDDKVVLLPQPRTGIGQEALLIPASAVKPRPEGGWITSLTVDQLGHMEMEQNP